MPAEVLLCATPPDCMVTVVFDCVLAKPTALLLIVLLVPDVVLLWATPPDSIVTDVFDNEFDKPTMLLLIVLLVPAAALLCATPVVWIVTLVLDCELVNATLELLIDVEIPDDALLWVKPVDGSNTTLVFDWVFVWVTELDTVEKIKPLAWITIPDPPVNALIDLKFVKYRLLPSVTVSVLILPNAR